MRCMQIKSLMKSVWFGSVRLDFRLRLMLYYSLSLALSLCKCMAEKCVFLDNTFIPFVSRRLRSFCNDFCFAFDFVCRHVPKLATNRPERVTPNFDLKLN